VPVERTRFERYEGTNLIGPMNLSLHHAHIALERRGWIHLLDAAGMRIACRSGTVWVTQSLDTRDVVLQPGDSLEIGRRGVTVVHATECASVMLEEGPYIPARRTSYWRKALDMVAQGRAGRLENAIGGNDGVGQDRSVLGRK
jgi:hypothetical protein